MKSRSPLSKYTSYLIMLGVGLAVLSSIALLSPFFEKYVFPQWFILLLFMLLIQWTVFAFVSKFGQHKTGTLLRQYQIAKYAKLFIYMIVLALYVFVVKINAMPMLIDFLVYYLFATGLEVWYLHRWMKSLPMVK